MPVWPYTTNTQIVLSAAILESGTGGGALGTAPQDGKKTLIGKWTTTEKAIYEQAYVEWPDTWGHSKGHSHQSCQYFPARPTAYGLICYHWGNVPFGTRAEQWTEHVGITKAIVGLSEIYIPGQLQMDLWVSMMDDRFGSWGIIPAKPFSDPITITIMGAFDLSVLGTQIRYTVLANAMDAQQRAWVESISFHHSIVTGCNYRIDKYVECWMANDGMPSDVPNLTGHYHVIHDTKVKSELYPADGTQVAAGATVITHAIAEASCTLSLFTVDGVDKLAANPFTTPPATADIHLAAVAGYGSITKQAGSVVSETLTLQVCANCGPVTWTADFGTLTGLTIGAATGIISGTIPYGTTPGTYPVTVTATNNSRAASRTFNIIVTLPPVYGTTWAALARVGVANAAVTALFQTSTGRVLVGVGNATNGSAIYYSDDLSTFTDFDPLGSVLPKRSQSITSFHEGASGRIFATTDITGARPMLLYSDDGGTNWTVALNANGTSNAGDVTLLGTSTILLPVITSLGRLRVYWSTDNGATWPAPNYFEYNPGPVLLSGRMLLTDDLHIVTSMTGVTTGSYIIKHDTTNDGAVYTDSTAGAVRGNPTKDSASKLLMPLQTLLLDGGTSGAAFTTRYTASGNIGVAKYLTQSVGLLGINGSPVTVLRSTDDMTTFGATTGTIDGTLCYCMCFLANGQILLGTNGTTNNLFRSAA